jgi:hypothetical protein
MPRERAESTASASEACSSGRAREGRDTDLAEVRTIEDHRLLGNPSLSTFLASPRPEVAAAAAIAIGRIGDTSETNDVAHALGSRHARVRRAAAFALGLLGGDDAFQALAAHAPTEKDDAVTAQVLLALARTGGAKAAATITGALTSSPEVATAAAEALGTVERAVADGFPLDAPTIARLVALSTAEPAALATRAAYALGAFASHKKTDGVNEADVTVAFQAASSESARSYLTGVLKALGTPSARAAA